MECVTAITLIIYSLLSNSVITEKLHLSKWINTCNSNSVQIYCFEYILTKDVNYCIEICKTRKECEYINYNRRFKMCSLIGMSSDINSETSTPECSAEALAMAGYIFGNKSEWNMDKNDICKNVNQTTEMSQGCKVSGCGVPDKNFTVINGNMFATGNRITYECKDGYNMKVSNTSGEHIVNGIPTVTAICLDNGTWTYVDFECIEEPRNVALGKTVTLSSQYNANSPGELMVDGDTRYKWPCACTKKESYPWALIDLERRQTITMIHVINRFDCCPQRLHDLTIHIGDDPTQLGLILRHRESVGVDITFPFEEGVTGRFVKLQIEATEYLTICELEIYATT